MDKIKQLVGMMRADKVIAGEMKKMVGIGSDLSQIADMQSKLLYNEAEKILVDLKKSGKILLFADKLLRVEKEIEKVREIDYNVCVYLNSEGWTGSSNKKVEKKIEVIKEDVELDFSGIDIFNPLQKAKEKVPILLAKNRIIDLAKMPHLLVAGQTGSGKSVFLNAVILSVLYKFWWEDCKLALIDPKRVEFSMYHGVPHLYSPVATRLDNIEKLLDSLVEEMEKRYELLEKTRVKSLDSYNRQEEKKLPYIVVVVDELADLMLVSGKSVETQITRLAQLARAVGIHLVLATQRPVVEIMTGLIKANMPARVAFKVASKQDSRVILDECGAETLRGAGELLFKWRDGIEKMQGVWVSEEQIKNIVVRK